MPRGRKKSNETLEEQLESIKADIDKTTEMLKSLKSKKKEIEGMIAEAEKEKLYQAVIKSGKNIDDILSVIANDEE